MSDSDKAPFEAKAKKASEKYKAAMAKYKLTDNYKKFQKLKEESKFDAVKKSKFKKDENAPTRPLSAYFLFMADERDELVAGGMSNKEAMTKMGEMWGSLSAAKKKPYQDKAAAAKAKYDKTVEKYRKTATYKKYLAEKDEFYANKKAELKKIDAKHNPSKSKSKSRSRARSKSAKRRSAKRSRSRSKSKKRSGKKAQKRSRSRSKSKKRSGKKK